jgi:hypothetical protein
MSQAQAFFRELSDHFASVCASGFVVDNVDSFRSSHHDSQIFKPAGVILQYQILWFICVLVGAFSIHYLDRDRSR